MNRISLTVSGELYNRLLIQAAKEESSVAWVARTNLEAFYRQRDLADARRGRHRTSLDVAGRPRTSLDVAGRPPDSSSKAFIALSSKALSSKALIVHNPQGFAVDPEVLSSWKETYPAVNVELEVRRAHEWILANPKNVKKNWYRYLVNWLSKAQDRAPRVQVEPEKARPAILDEQNGDVSPMPAEIREQMRKIVDGVKMP